MLSTEFEDIKNAYLHLHRIKDEEVQLCTQFDVSENTYSFLNLNSNFLVANSC